MEHDKTDLVYPLPDDKKLESSKLKEFADGNFKLDENGSKLSKRVENTVGKGEIARYEQFLLFPQCFRKACFPEGSKGVIVWEWVKSGLVTHASYLFCIYIRSSQSNIWRVLTFISK